MGNAVSAKDKMSAAVVEFVKNQISRNSVIMFSKSYCPYCDKAKNAFKSIGVEPVVIELDERNDGDAIQNELGKITGGKTVPRVFVGGKFIGGGDDTAAAARSGKLAEWCKAAL